MADIWLSDNEASEDAQALTASYERSGIYHTMETMCVSDLILVKACH